MLKCVSLVSGLYVQEPVAVGAPENDQTTLISISFGFSLNISVHGVTNKVKPVLYCELYHTKTPLSQSQYVARHKVISVSTSGNP